MGSNPVRVTSETTRLGCNDQAFSVIRSLITLQIEPKLGGYLPSCGSNPRTQWLGDWPALFGIPLVWFILQRFYGSFAFD